MKAIVQITRAPPKTPTTRPIIALLASVSPVAIVGFEHLLAYSVSRTINFFPFI